MSKEKFYAVKLGRTKGIFKSWDECKNSVEGFPNAVFKSFPSLEEADKFLRSQESTVQKNTQEEIIAYIDGSYDDTLKAFSYAAIIFDNNEKVIYSDAETDPDTVKLRNVAGELKAAMFAMKYVLDNNKKKLNLYYDYTGIEMWATGKWKANLDFTKKYVQFTKEMSKEMDINFVKVKAHSGDKYNEEVDKLAKAALQKISEKTKHSTSDLNQKEINNNPNDTKQERSIINTNDTKQRETVDISTNDIKQQESADISTNDAKQESVNINVNNTQQEKEILSKLKGSKTTLNIHFMLEDSTMISQENIINAVKAKWKKDGKLVKDIQKLKSFYNVESKSFTVGIYSGQKEYIYTLKIEDIKL